MAGKPLFWRMFDKADEVIAPRLEEAVRGDAFLSALGLAARGRARVRRDSERRSQRLWHLVNLPAGSDVTHLRRQVAELDRELRRVSIALEHALVQRRREEEGSRATPSSSICCRRALTSSCSTGAKRTRGRRASASRTTPAAICPRRFSTPARRRARTR